METLKILIYGDIDINIIDGSSIWITSIINVLSINSNIKIDYLLKKTIRNNTVINSIYDIQKIYIIDPFSKFNIKGNKLTPNQASKCIELLDNKNKYDCIIVRGIDICREICKKEALRKKIISYVIPEKNNKTATSISNQEKEKLIYIYNNSKYIFSQTEESKELFKKVLNINSDEKFILLPPMIPEVNKEELKFKNKKNRLIYSGKFSEKWNSYRILKACQKIIENDASISLTVICNKFHKDIEDKEDEILDILENGENINWIPGVSRTEVFDIMKEHDIGIAWRSEEIDNDNSVELSTKVLEYASLGIPVILKRTKLHENLFGKDYPLFIEDDENDFINKINLALYDNEIYIKCSYRVYNSVKKYAFKEVYKSIHLKLWSLKKDKINLVFAGHDMKFIDKFIEYCKNSNKYSIRIDQWQGHNKHDMEYSKECLEWADIIFCEWGLGNAKWYSNNKREYQKLIVRIHKQEIRTDYFKAYNVNNIDYVICITPYMFEEISKIMNIPREKIRMVFNYIDCNYFNKTKITGCEYNLGIVGICPKIKRLDLAVDILEKLCEKDSRYKLYIKGKQPKEYTWLWKNEDERIYYENLLDRISQSKYKDNIIFDGFGSDLDEWYRKIGFLLSTSDLEGSHVSVAEGMASGCVPIIFNWNGADTIYQNDYICNNENKAIELIDKNRNSIGSENLKNYSKVNFDINKVFNEIENLMIFTESQGDIYAKWN